MREESRASVRASRTGDAGSARGNQSRRQTANGSRTCGARGLRAGK